MLDGIVLPLATALGIERERLPGLQVDDPAARLRRLAERLSEALDPSARPLAEELLAAAEEAEQALRERRLRIHQLENLSMTDELTGALNRRGFQEMLGRALADAERHGEEGLLLLCDLDHFKATNDTYGHPAGDLVLATVADKLRRSTRRSDSVARLGGDEFAVLMPRAPVGRAAFLVEKLSRMVNALLVPWQGSQIPVAASFGWESYGRNSRADRLFFLADRKLYRRKHATGDASAGH